MIRCLLLLCCLFGLLGRPVLASPGLCTGPVCADDITRSAKNHWQLILRLNDQQGHREKVVMDLGGGGREGLVVVRELMLEGGEKD